MCRVGCSEKKASIANGKKERKQERRRFTSSRFRRKNFPSPRATILAKKLCQHSWEHLIYYFRRLAWDSPLSSSNWDYYTRQACSIVERYEKSLPNFRFNDDNDEIAFDDEIRQYLFGIGSHHAGMLPRTNRSWRSCTATN
jgi:hypothetical protein